MPHPNSILFLLQIVNKTAAVQMSDLAIDVIPKFKTWLSSKVTFSCDASGYEGDRSGRGGRRTTDGL